MIFTLLGVQAGCVVRQTPTRSAFSSTPASASAMVFDSAAVRHAMLQRGVSPDAARWEYARNNADLGVRTHQQNHQDRLYRDSDWYGQSISAFHNRFISANGRAARTPILSPAQERSHRLPY